MSIEQEQPGRLIASRGGQAMRGGVITRAGLARRNVRLVDCRSPWPTVKARRGLHALVRLPRRRNRQIAIRRSPSLPVDRRRRPGIVSSSRSRPQRGERRDGRDDNARFPHGRPAQ
jgi:hypothetical protein